MRSQRPAHRQTVHRVDVESGKLRRLAKQLECLLKTLVFVLVSFDYSEDLSPGAMLGERFRKTSRFLAMIFRVQHAGYDRYLRTRRHKLTHQFSSQTTVQLRFHTHDAGAPAFGSVGGDADYANSLFLGFVNERL